MDKIGLQRDDIGTEKEEADQKDRQKILDLRKEYISKTFVQFEMLKSLHSRELAFLSAKSEKPRKAFRYFWCKSLEFFRKHLNFVGFEKNLLNCYMSVAVLKDIPIFSYNLNERLDEPKYKEFGKNYANHIIGINLFMDFDCKNNFEKGLNEVREMKKILDSMQIPYFIMNSSFHGFHIHIPSEYMPDYDNKLMQSIGELLSNIKAIYEFETLDISIGDIKRLCKTPYSPVTDNSVCLPLSDSQVQNFQSYMVSIENVLRCVKIQNRGLLVRDYGLDKNTLKQNVLKFFEEFH